MPLKMRPTGLGSGIDKGRPDYTVYTGEWDVGRIYQTRGGPESALVLVHERQRYNDTLRSRGDLGGSQSAVSEKLGRLEGVGEGGRGAPANREPRRGRGDLRARFLDPEPPYRKAREELADGVAGQSGHWRLLPHRVLTRLKSIMTGGEARTRPRCVSIEGRAARAVLNSNQRELARAANIGTRLRGWASYRS
jgi:hypothetical protein